MAEPANDRDVPREISDDLLAEVSGGLGNWSAKKEQNVRLLWASVRGDTHNDVTWEEFAERYGNVDTTAARNAWIAAGRPTDIIYWCDKGNLWTEER